MTEESADAPQPAPDAASREDLFAFLDRLNITHKTVEHEAIFTVEQGRALKRQWAGGHSKNLFLKDKKGSLFLAVALGETRVDLVGLGKRIGAKGRLSFGKPALMTETLGVIPGAVTPFTLINKSAAALSSVILDTALLACDPVWFHPLENTASTAIAPSDLKAFVSACGFEAQIIDLEAPLAS
ncbi:prolyl-tRNA synthetase associated domain-containing protein [Hyphococcus flavus]|uniref:Prolyl-tRNA synthetase associated domain-containing protein n=1 Tax=Hyphococcus flavus TaxID=1866326 RepID=A0AAE9ZLA0_9PROT|nr:prolyl-tRNA synthetase associated domain-containing protein [Hyphococcus flavus]WDI32715.1 prolyl-tRNA synthetase associated domain-containing protein [Hyphococcus flavus]